MPAATMKPAITHCDDAPKASTPRASVENPPVGSVVIAWASASNGLMRSSTPVQANALSTTTIARVSAT
jgi:hypothetical protein